MSRQIRVFIVDRDASYRDALRDGLSDLPDIEVLGTSPSGKLGLLRVSETQPDLVVLDTTLEDITAPRFTQMVIASAPNTGVLVIASQATVSADMTIEALEVGAFDFIVRPPLSNSEPLATTLQRLLIPKIRCFSIRRYSQMVRQLSAGTPLGTPIVKTRATPNTKKTATTRLAVRRNDGTYDVVLIGVSTGGPEALSHLIPALPADLPVPVLIVLHMPKLFTSRMAKALNRASKVAVREAVDGDIPQPGVVYLAPGGHHMITERAANQQVVLRMTDGPAENGCKPSADMLFRSSARVYHNHAIGVILTGMGGDGTKGLLELKRHGARIIAQDRESSVVWGMPGNAVKAGCTKEVLPLDAIADKITEILLQQQI